MVEVAADGAPSEAGSEAEVVEAAEDYRQAVDQENWAYTATINVVVDGSASDPEVSVTVYRTFKDGTSIIRDTFFVSEDGEWKHRRLRRHGLRLQGRVVAPAPPDALRAGDDAPQP